MSHSFDRMLDSSFRGRPLAELVEAPPSALTGVSANDAKLLEEALGVTTLRELAESPVFRAAQAILAATGTPACDSGPPPDWERFFAAAPLAHYTQHPSSRFRLDFGPVFYRGRLDGSARVMFVGQDPAENEILAHRILIGSAGQRTQGFLRKLGITRSYVMVNTFLFSILRQFDSKMRMISLEEPILAFRNTFFDRIAQQNPIEVIIAAGAAARHAVQNWPGRGNLPVVEILHPSARDEAALVASWNDGLATLQNMLAPDEDGQPDPTPYGPTFTPQDHAPIPRFDLPFGLPDWHGRGDHGKRDGPKKIIWTAP